MGISEKKKGGVEERRGDVWLVLVLCFLLSSLAVEDTEFAFKHLLLLSH